MIKINKQAEPPKILLDNKEKWTNNLMEAVKKYGSYKKIPRDEKEKLLKNYKHRDIQSILFDSSYMKCVFCECKPAEGGNIEVEHFAPKSLYPHLTFEWSNLLPICRNCNGSKSNHDTLNSVIINPSEADPDRYFDFKTLKMVTSDTSPNKDISENTLNVISNLNSPSLFRVRADLLYTLATYEDDLEYHIKEIESSGTERQRSIRINKLKKSLELIEELCKPNEKYSGFVKNYVFKSDVITKAKKIVSEFFSTLD
ncbi:conserved hypothetical protein [[Clostridium] sordellii]|uniref:HNH nuclease domain-containing protein n=1 Tax=Paraclostridium sordellii TaxID=1505 RepID=A0ABM9RP63_PARSO|nr:HNH endonuclease [Paeniclostridium sordellii]EPZ57422.1 HNH endonuclease family protein [[Clostridium] sordellii ATCC 9714] [Paeniclostridium sordellii ATCC 9714]CEJ73610.1 hypothetical protein ATCC9714_14981 [[Clostridium] sordellii] [Paeniclostridium sordellii]CEN69158.1 conserved hypothetical protein [[Clostridium] sordellii] [Paeniclostridium sordellii]CEN72426.1 conserved hypothetical protein [[Clostridium] sordellii] [Paeniclostridium sordellii]CEO23852.1 conserved hypothetical protei